MKADDNVGYFVGLLIAIPISMLDAVVVMYGWNTFITRLFDLPAINNLVLIFGALTFFNYLIAKTGDDRSPLTWGKLYSAIVSILSTWLLMFIIQLFI